MRGDRLLDVGTIGALVHQSALGFSPWLESLQAVASHTGSERGQLIGLTMPVVNFNWVTSFDDASIAEFERMDGGDPTYNFRVAAGLNAMPNEIVSEAQYDLARQHLGDERYLDFCERLDIPYGCQTIVANGSAGFVGLAVLRTKADGATRADELEAFRHIVPHVRRAVELQWAIEGQGQKLLLGSFDAVDQAVIFLDAAGRALAQTVAADDLLAGVQSPRIINRQLLCDHPRDQAMLEKALNAVLSGVLGDATIVVRQGDAMPLFGTIHAFAPPESNIGFRPRAILILRSMARTGARRETWLRFAGLTPAEIEIAQALAQGLPRGLIADQRGAQIGTVRQQIKTIFAKLGVRREAEFIALLGNATHR